MLNEYVYEDHQVENKVTKRHYPRTNNDQVLDFVFEKEHGLNRWSYNTSFNSIHLKYIITSLNHAEDPNLYLRKNKILIKGTIEVDDEYIPDVGFVSKLFSMLTVDVCSHTVSSNKTKWVKINCLSDKYFCYVLGGNTF